MAALIHLAASRPRLFIYVFALTLSVLLPASVCAQTGRIVGKVTEKGSGETLFGANVIIQGTSLGMATDAEGNYVIQSVPAGTHVVAVSYIGFRAVRNEVTVQPGQTVTLNVELEWEGVIGSDVVVTAQARGQMAAINQQLTSNTITNVVSADRIREIPDVNAAESIGRLPGVSIQRSGGEANRVAIRGLSPRYNTVTVNGVRVPTTSTDDRSVDLSLISSNMLDGIEVSKALTADKDADAIGGAVDLKLKEAPDAFAVDILGQGGYNRIQDYYGNYKFSGSLSNRFFDRKFGVIANFNLDEYDRSADKLSGSYRLAENNGVRTPVMTTMDLNEDRVLRGRLGGSIVADYRIPNGKVVGNVFYNQLTNDQTIRNNRYQVNIREHFYRMLENEWTTDIMTTALGVDQSFKWLRYDAGVAYSTMNNDSPRNYIWQFQEPSAFSNDLTDAATAQQIPTLALNDLDNTRLSQVYVRDQASWQNETTLHANAKTLLRQGQWLNGSLKVGGKYRVMERSNDENQIGRNMHYGGDQQARNLLVNQMPELGLTGVLSYLPMSVFLDSYSRTGFLEGDYPLGYTMNHGLMERATRLLEENEFLLVNKSESASRDYSGIEKLGAIYAMAEINIGPKLSLMPGYRYEREYSRYNGKFTFETSDTQPLVSIDTTSTRRNSFLLPMHHAKYSPFNWLDIRFAYTQTLTRPDYIRYAPITFVGLFDYVSAGNPTLVPSLATNLDLSVSVFNNRLGLFTVSAFKKNIRDLIWQTEFSYLPNQQVIPGLDLQGKSGSPIVQSAGNNKYRAYYDGIELDWQTNFWYLPSVLKGLVLNVNYTYIVSETKYTIYRVERIPIEPRPPRPPFTTSVISDTLREGRMPDQPNNIMNVTVGYDFKGFSARVSFLYQSNTSSWISPRDPADDRFTDDYFRMDMALKQNIPFNIQLFANFNNMNSRADRNYQASIGEYPTYVEYYGFTMDVGLRYRF